MSADAVRGPVSDRGRTQRRARARPLSLPPCHRPPWRRRCARRARWWAGPRRGLPARSSASLRALRRKAVTTARPSATPGRRIGSAAGAGAHRGGRGGSAGQPAEPAGLLACEPVRPPARLYEQPADLLALVARQRLPAGLQPVEDDRRPAPQLTPGDLLPAGQAAARFRHGRYWTLALTGFSAASREKRGAASPVPSGWPAIIGPSPDGSATPSSMKVKRPFSTSCAAA
jgi:hypothetical protein